METIKRGDIVYADLRPSIGSEQDGIRPVLVVQNDKGNLYSPTTIIATITSSTKAALPTHVNLHRDRENGLETDSTVLLEQIRTIDKQRIQDKIGRISPKDLDRVMKAMRISLDMI